MGGGKGEEKEKFPHCVKVPLPNQSPKGNMLSAIPFALLFMIVNLSERKQGRDPEGD